MSIIGFDDSLFTNILTTKLTTVNYDFSEIGATAAKLLIDDIKNPYNPKRKISFSPSLIERESVMDL